MRPTFRARGEIGPELSSRFEDSRPGRFLGLTQVGRSLVPSIQLLLGLADGFSHSDYLLLAGTDRFLDDETLLVRHVSRAWQVNRLNLHGGVAEDSGHGRGDGLAPVGVGVVAADEKIRWCIQVFVVNARDAVPGQVRLARQAVGADVIRFEERAEGVILFLGHGIEHVLVAAGTVDRDAEKCLGRVFDGVIEPDVAIERKPVAHQKARGPQGRGIRRSQLVAREHLLDHAVVALVLVERLDDPVAPVPDVRLAFAHFLAKAGPVAVTPNIHPVPAPALAVTRAGQQAVDDLLIRLTGCVGQESVQLRPCRREAGEIEGHAAQPAVPGRLWTRLEPPRFVLGGDEGVDRVSHPGTVTDHRQRRSLHLLKRMPLVRLAILLESRA